MVTEAFVARKDESGGSTNEVVAGVEGASDENDSQGTASSRHAERCVEAGGSAVGHCS
jgi:hypothetical protein